MDTVGGGEERFPGFDVVGQAETWDDVTRAVVLARTHVAPYLTFFSAPEEVVARTLLDRLLAQESEPRVPAVELIDARLAAGEGDGYRYGDMPTDGEAWRRSLAGLEQDALERFGAPFSKITIADQHAIIQTIQDSPDVWRGIPAARLFGLWMRYACTAFYSHPSAWNEIGFGGPAYPRGYKNMGIGRREPWETASTDAVDPVPWAKRVEAARRRHTQPGSGAGE